MKKTDFFSCLVALVIIFLASLSFASERNDNLEDRIKFLENKLVDYETTDQLPNFKNMGQKFDEMAKIISEQIKVLDKSFEKYNSTLKVNRLKDRIEIVGNFPDYEKSEIKISTTDDFVTIAANKKDEKKSKSTYQSSSYNSFYQSVGLPFNAMTDKITAKYYKNNLKITVPLDLKKKKVRRINIK